MARKSPSKAAKPPANTRKVTVYANRDLGQTQPWELTYVLTQNPPQGALKKIFFSPDKKWAVGFFHDPSIVSRKGIRKRMEAILGKYNPTRSERNGGRLKNTENQARYYQTLFCWPVGTVEDPDLGFGIVSPCYPDKFFLGESVSPNPGLSKAWAHKDKQTTWFTRESLRRNFKERELGDFRNTLRICSGIAQSIECLHKLGLAHSDLSCNNVLVDPMTGSSIIIDIDSLVVPDLYPPDVVGTRGYIAPEVLETLSLPFDDPRKKMPRITTDLYAMAVLFYELLLLRHPLEGPKQFGGADADPEEEDMLMYGSQALFIEDPQDQSNRPGNLAVTIRDLGPKLEHLFIKTFCGGLHNPVRRAAAFEWVDALNETMDLLYPCANSNCPMGWFVLYDTRKPVCPFCKTAAKRSGIVRMIQHRPDRGHPGQWVRWDRDVNLYDGKELFRRHFNPYAGREEQESPEPVAVIKKVGKTLCMVNRKVANLTLENGEPILPMAESTEIRPENCVPLSGETWLAATDGGAALLLEVQTGTKKNR